MLYNFFDAELWKTRTDSLDDALDVTVHLINDALVNIDGLSVTTLAQLLNETKGDVRQQQVAHLVRDVEETIHAYLSEQLMTAIRGLSPDAIAELLIQSKIGNGTRPVGYPDQILAGDEYKQTIVTLGDDLTNEVPWHLGELLKEMLTSGRLPLSAKPRVASIDFEFQVKQLLNLYTLWIALNSAVWANLRESINDSLAMHENEGTLPLVSLYRECFWRVSIDFEFIQRATVQRKWIVYGLENKSMSLQAKTLLVTDKLAFRAAEPMRAQLLNGAPISIVTCFSSHTYIHHLPYNDNIVLIGLSYDIIPPKINERFYSDEELTNQQDMPSFELMAIPHEIGHYVYHNARLSDGKTFAEISNEFDGNPYRRWCEEIFADMYGCLVSGALTPLGLQAMLATGEKERAWHDDGEHPLPAVRPLILSEILRELSKHEKTEAHYQFNDVADDLNVNWMEILENWGCVDDTSTILADVMPIITTFTNRLVENVDFSSDIIPWSRGYTRSLEEDESSLKVYDHDMSRLTSSQFASAKIPHQTIVDMDNAGASLVGATADETLQNYLKNWDDGGAKGDGPH